MGLSHQSWLIPLAPLLAAAIGAVLPRHARRASAALAIGSMVVALVLSVAVFADLVGRVGRGEDARWLLNFRWFELGAGGVSLGLVADPLAAVMLVMVSLVGLLIFIYSVGYMAHDPDFSRFFCFLSLFAAGMFGVVLANSLLLLFGCWEVVGLASYLLIGFWFHKPSAAAAAKKAFITTRVGDLALFLGMLWLASASGTLLFYDDGRGVLEPAALAGLASRTTLGGAGLATAIGLLIFVGAMGKSGQVPLHGWLPDAMEGPTPVSALIHAATMVAAGVFLVARVYPLMSATAAGLDPARVAPALQVVTWVGAITALFAAAIAVAQNDIKRILAYSTVSQLGYMMVGLGVGGVAVGLFHLITHACFKALLFLGAGSVIHGCHEEQDIRRMGGLRRLMPLTFLTYAIGMLALSGVPLVASGFWSKDAILHAAHRWPGSPLPFYLGLAGALLTAFYMTRQVCHVFFGSHRGSGAAPAAGTADRAAKPHESPPVMTVPLVVLAFCAVAVGFVGTPGWPWFQEFIQGRAASVRAAALVEPEFLWLALVSSAVVALGLGAGVWLYGRPTPGAHATTDPLERWQPELHALLRNECYVDEAYNATAVRAQAAWARGCAWLDRWLWASVVAAVAYGSVGLAWLSRWTDEYVVNAGFDAICRRIRVGGGRLSALHNGRVHAYLRVLAVALAVLLLWLGSGGTTR